MGLALRPSHIATGVALCALLVACAETQLVMHTAKRLSRGEEGVRQPLYKVGSPYQINGVWYYPKVDYDYAETGIASWYGEEFHGRPTANGETFDMNRVSAAHRTLPLPSMVQVTNLENGRSIRARVNDRGPFAHGRVVDLSRRAARLLGFLGQGTAKVRVEILPEESRRLAALAGAGATQVARADEPTRAQDFPPVEAAPRVAVTEAPLSATEAPPAPATDGPARAESVHSVPVRASAMAAPTGDDERITQWPVEPSRMYVQAGAFADFQNADRLRARLSVLGPATVTPVMAGSREFFRVRLGPMASLSAADRMLERVIGAGFPGARLVVDH
jgi:rare lipoprotein A